MFSVENTGFQFKVVTGPALLPITKEEAINYLKASFGDHDEELGNVDTMIKSAYHLAERFLGCPIMSQTRDYFWRTYGEDVTIFGPNTAIVEVARAENQVETALVQGTDYHVAGLDDLTLRFSKVWTASSGLTLQSLRVRATGGHASLLSVEAEIKVGMLKQVATDYYHRVNFGNGLEVLSNKTKSVISHLSKEVHI